MKIWRWRQRVWFPLLGKELTEMAARKRTYVVRVVYAALLFFIFATFFFSQLRGIDNPLYILGKGRQLFDMLIALQFAGVFIFLPAIMSSAVTQEKERDSLALLFLTDLRPWEIVLQKYISRLIPMFTFLLLSLPLMALAYSIGGIQAGYLTRAAYMLMLAALQVGAMSLMFSCYCRGTVSSFVTAYIGGAIFYLLPILLAFLDHELFRNTHFFADEDVALGLFPPYLFYECREKPFLELLARSIPVWGTVAVFLLLARLYLVKRAFLPARNATLHLFRWFDAVMHSWNKVTGGIVLVKDRATMPLYEPVYWRETTKKSLGKFHYLLRVFLAVEVPALFIGLGACMTQNRGWSSQLEALSVMIFALWILAALVVTVVSAASVPSERATQTLEVLLTTPMAGRQIVKEKARALHRLMGVFLLPILTLMILEVIFETYSGALDAEHAAQYVFASLLCLLLYLPMLSWVAMWIGLKTRSRARAIVTALVALVVWCVAPIFAMIVGMEAFGLRFLDEPPWSLITLLSPATIVPCIEFRQMDSIFRNNEFLALVINFAVQGWILLWFRSRCLRKADQYLGRAMPRWNRETELSDCQIPIAE